MGEQLTLSPDLSGLAQIEVVGEWKPFWDGAKRGELLIQQCPSCGHRQFYPRNLCLKCAATPEWLICSGRGVLYTYSVVRQHFSMPFKGMLPLVTAMVDLEEGVRMMTNLIDCDLDDVHIGMPLEVKFVEAREELTVPYWRPARAG